MRYKDISNLCLNALLKFCIRVCERVHDKIIVFSMYPATPKELIMSSYTFVPLPVCAIALIISAATSTHKTINHACLYIGFLPSVASPHARAGFAPRSPCSIRFC